MSLRILHVTDCYLPRVGGIELHVRDLVEHQRARGHDVHVLTTTPASSLADPDWVHRVRGSARLEGRTWDAVHVHLSILSPFATSAARQAGRLGWPTVVTMHSMVAAYGVLPGLAAGTIGAARWPVLWSAVSDAAADQLAMALGGGVRVHTLPNAVDPLRWAGTSPVDGGAAPVATVVSVSRMTRTKRTLPLAAILRSVRAQLPAETPLRAVLVGDGPQRPALRRYLARHAMASWVDLPGTLDRPAIARLLAAADVYLAPAELESFGIAALEARSAGLPVVASSRGGVREFVTHGVEGLLADDDRGLAGAVTRLLVDDDLKARIADHNRTVPTACDWPTACDRAEALYARAAAIAGPREPVLAAR